MTLPTNHGVFMETNVQNERIELARRAHDGDRAALDQLVRSHLWLVRRVTGQYANYGAHADDLFQVGCMALMTAASKFDASKGFQFTTYARWYFRRDVQRMAWGDKRKRAVSLNAPIGEDGDACMMDLLEDSSTVDGLDAVETQQEANNGGKVISLLTPKEATAVSIRFGVELPVDDGPAATRLRAIEARCLRGRKDAVGGAE